MSFFESSGTLADNSAFATTLIAALEVRIKDARRLQRNPNAMASIDRQIRSAELLRLVMQNGEVKTNRSKETPLILAVKTGDLSLVKYFAEHSLHAVGVCENCEYTDLTVTELLSHRNENRENALLIALSMSLEVGVHPRASPTTSIDTQDEQSYQPDRVLIYLLQLALRESRSSAVFYNTTERRQNLLHIAFGKVCPSCEDFCVARYVLQALMSGSVFVDPRQEDHKHFTPLFYMLKRGNKDADLPTDRDFQSENENDEDSDQLRRQKLLIRELKLYSESFSVPWEEMLVNSYGMDVAHICASSNSIQFLMKHQIEEMAPGSGLHLILYHNEPAEFDSQMVLGGPIDDQEMDRKEKTLRHIQLQPQTFKYGLWTALHFACNGGHSESMAYLMQRGFSLQDCTRNGATCIDLVFAKPDRQEAILCAFQIVSDGAEGRAGPLGRSWVLEYAACVDSVRGALDNCEGDCERTEGAPTESAADAELDEAWRLFKKSQKYRGLTSLDEMNVKSLMYMCFENDSATQYRALIRSTFWKRAIENPKLYGFHLSGEAIVDEVLPDRDFIKFFINVMEELPEMEAEVPIKERLGVKVDFMWWTFEGLSLDRRQSNAVSRRPLFSYRDNGKVFLRKLDKPTTYFRLLSMVDLAIITGRCTMAKALLITRQFDLIPTAVSAIIRCNRLIQEEHLINYYPIRDANPELRSVKAFSAKVAINAIDMLFRGCRDREADLVFEYLLGKMGTHDGTGRESALPHSKRLVRKMELKRGKELNQSLSTLELIRKSEYVDFYGAECIQQLVEKMWHEPPEYHNNNSNHAYESAVRLVDRSQSGKPNLVQRLKRHLQCPRRRLILYAASTVFYIAILISSLTFPSIRWNWTDIVLICFLFTLAIQEGHECYIRSTTISEGFRSYLFDIWNVYDLLNISFLMAALSYKAVIRFGQWGELDDPDATAIGDMESAYTHFCYKILMSHALFMVSMRFLKILRFSRSIGVNIVMLPYIFYRDLMPFVTILFLMIVSFGTIFMSLLTVGRYRFDGSSIQRRNDSILFEIYTRPLLAAFGDFQIDALEGCDHYGTNDGCYFASARLFYKRFVLIAFLLTVNLVMFNMLIAKFSNTVSRSEKRWQLLWLALRHELLIDYCRLSSWPPPLNILGILWSALQKCFKRTCNSNAELDPEDARKRLSMLGRNHERFILRQADRFRRMRHRMQTRIVETIQDDIEEELLGDDINWSGASIQFDRTKQANSRGVSASANDAVSKKLDELLRRSRRMAAEEFESADALNSQGTVLYSEA